VPRLLWRVWRGAGIVCRLASRFADPKLALQNLGIHATKLITVVELFKKGIDSLGEAILD
jgi:hypothetical protein